MEQIKCTRKTSYSLGEGKSFDAKAGEIYSVGRDKDVPRTIAVQMIQNRTAVAYVKPTKETLVEENKLADPVDENKSVDESSNAEDEQSDENKKPLDAMNKDELLAYANDNNIDVSSLNKNLGKDRLREAIIAAEEGQNE